MPPATASGDCEVLLPSAGNVSARLGLTMTSATQQLDSHAPAYTAAFAHFEENRIVHQAYGQRLARRIAGCGAKDVLSLGIGHMEVSLPIVELLRSGVINHYVVVDAAPAILQAFEAQLAPLPAGLQLVEAFFERYETEGRRFDAIEAGFVLEHVEDPALLLRRLREWVAPQGRLFVAVPNARSLHRLLGQHAGLLEDVYTLSDADLALGHRRYFDVALLTDLAQRCGWRIESQAGLLLKPFTTGQLAKLALPPQVWAALQALAEPYPDISNAFCMELVPCN